MKNDLSKFQVYLVGGAVRDITFNVTPKDWDFVVVGATQQDMLDAGFQQVGKDFPVFLNDNGDEYALARTERSTGDGYKDFTFSTDNVTLEQDLARRDLTINAMAVPQVMQYQDVSDLETKHLIDPYNGLRDAKNKVLRHVTDEGFVEDPLRVLRLARFCAKYADFTVAPETFTLVQKMVADGMLNHLTPERVAGEMVKALSSKAPSRFFVFLKMVGALAVLFPELEQLVNVPAGSYRWHPEGDTFTHTMLVLDQASKMSEDPVVRFCALTHDLGKGTTRADVLPHHYGHEERGVPLVDAMCDRLRLPNEYRQNARLVARYHTHVHNVFKLNPKTFVKMADDLKPKQNTDVFNTLCTVSMADTRGRGVFYEYVAYPNSDMMWRALMATQLNARDVCTEEELKNVNLLKDKLYRAKLAAVKKVLDQADVHTK